MMRGKKIREDKSETYINKSTSTTTMKQIKCATCNYQWNYEGKLMRATCPSCGGKVKVK